MRQLIRWFVENPVATNLLMWILILGGLMTLPMIHKEEFPNVEFDAVKVDVSYPGASPAEVEQSVCIRIEEAVEGTEGIKKISTTAVESLCSVVIEILKSTDKSKALNDIKGKIDAIDSFPVEAENPVVSEVTLLAKVLEVAISGHTDERSLKELGERMRSDLLESAEISQVALNYVRPYEISIEVSEQNLRRYGLTLQQVADAVSSNSIDLPGGSIKTFDGEILVRTAMEAKSAIAFEQIVVLTRADGTNVYLGDIAEVRDGYEDTDLMAFFNGEPAIVLDVRRIGSEDVLEVAGRVKHYVEDARQWLPEGISVTVWQDESQDLVDRLDVMGSNARSGLILVMLVLALFLRVRLALWVAAGVPIALMGAVMLFPVFGMSISTISVMGVILVLGILVDDAIVVGERVYAHEQMGKDPLHAAIDGAHEVSVPVIFGVMTTMVAFMPVIFMPSSMGPFFAGIGVTAILALFFSLIESQLILPMHLAHRKRTQSARSKFFVAAWWGRLQDQLSSGLERFADEAYMPLLQKALYWRYATAALAIAAIIIIIGLLASGRIIFQFFPSVDGNRIYAALTMPEGTPVETTRQAVARIEQAGLLLQAELDAKRGPGESSMVKHTMSSIGKGFAKSSIEFGGRSGSNIAEIGIELDLPADYSGTPPTQIAARWRELTGFVPDAVELTFTAEAFTAGKAIDIQLRGSNQEQLKEAAAQLRNALQAYQGVHDVSDSYRGGKQEVKLVMLPEAHNLGLSGIDLARQVRQAFYGEEVQRLQRGREDMKVMVRYPESERRSLGDLENMRIRSSDGREVPFSSVAEVELGVGNSSIVRENGKRVIRVLADVDRTVISPEEILASLESSVIKDLLEQYPGMDYGLAGEAEEANEAMAGLIFSSAMALLVIYALLAIPLKSYLQPLVIMSVIPFGFMGAVIGHFILGWDLIFFSLLGIVALSGVVVNSSLVMVDYINRRRREGKPLLLAVSTAGVARFRPIVLTSVTTFVGLIPLIATSSLATMVFTPMAISLAFGVLFATVITLFLVPCFYLILEDAIAGVAAARRGLRVLFKAPVEAPSKLD